METKDWIGSAVIFLLSFLLLARKRNAQASILETRAVQAEQKMWQNTVITLTERIEELTQEVHKLRRENEDLNARIEEFIRKTK